MQTNFFLTTAMKVYDNMKNTGLSLGNPSQIKSLGICLGASTVSLVQLQKKMMPNNCTEGASARIIDYKLYPHNGDPKNTLNTALKKLDITSFKHIVATGRRFRKLVNITQISEPVAVELAYQYVKADNAKTQAVVSAGGETFMAYILDDRGKISNVLTGNKCASGTGEFFLQQLRRMNLNLEDAAQFTMTDDLHAVSGRCSVFCKSDCTHAMNKGILKSKVAAGLCSMMANKIIELLKKEGKKYIMITGGTALNQMMIDYLKKEIPDVTVPDEAPYFEALGAALWAFANETKPLNDLNLLFNEDATSFDTHPPLNDYVKRVIFKKVKTGLIKPKDVCFLGLDVGSTTTKAVLIKQLDNTILAKVYLRTNGDPVGASRKCYHSIIAQIEKHVPLSQISIIGIGICGSGRQIAGLHALTDGVINEIIAHATAAVYFDPKVDTIFEIGGQDAK